MTRPIRSRSLRRTLLSGGTVLGLAGLLAACTPASGDDAAEGEGGDGLTGSITVYTSEPQEKLDELIADFNEVEPDIEVNAFRAGTGDLTARLESEQTSGGIQADVLLAADAPTFEGYKADGLLAQYEPAGSDAIGEHLRDPEGYYTGTRIIPTVIAYNTGEIDTPPASWQDLTDPALQGQITLPNPAVSGAAAFNAAVWYLDDRLGEEWFEALGANEPVIAESNGPVSQAVASGQQPIGIVVDYLVRDLRDAGSPIEVSYPSEGVPYVYQPVGIFESSENQEAAQAFVDYLVGERGQALAAEQNYLPVREDAPTPEGAPALSELSLLSPDLDEVTAVREDALDVFTNTIG
ncbi:ABC transporter substrate-binding protein [Sediminivirga luteola]|uniref:ABC transporter periplasmic component n=1 Tax=Sediminivirga luteola TaxID=1774748 RepID=A0A8J2TXK1_9MICO|nr:ABC transporter substrate-binding protein [Sediminivirga luteola]MCI2266269.1 ABC transporter substrate-binding protein [Sediminivirga luteola]GGA12229.1 ABC transporter periplasmic component [Sediminivirga luteola]